MRYDRFVDLYRLRVAVAAVYWVRLHLAELLDNVPPPVVRRLDAAVTYLGGVQPDLGGELGAGCHDLLSPEPDVDGARTVAAIDRLAVLTHVDEACAAALASLADDALPDRACPRTLFDSDGDAPIDEAASG